MLAAACRPSQTSVLESGLSAFVPSDACAVLYCKDASSAQELLFEPGDDLSKIKLNSLKHKEMLLSCHYYGEMEVLLLLRLDSSSRGLSKASAEIVEQVNSLGLESLLMDDVLLVSKSASLISSARRHVAEGTSIKDVPAVNEAFALGKKDSSFYAVVRNDALRYIFPKERKFLGELFERAQLLKYFESFSSYFLLSLDSVSPVLGGEYLNFSVNPLVADSLRQYAAYADKLPLRTRQLDKYIPSGCKTYLYESVGADDEYFKNRNSWLDANGQLKNSDRLSKSYRRAIGDHPQNWARSLGIDEIAKISSRGQQMLALHCCNKPDSIPEYMGGLPALLYGREFALKDESSLVIDGENLLIGSEQSLEYFLGARASKLPQQFPGKESKAMLMYGRLLLDWGKEGIKMTVYKTY